MVVRRYNPVTSAQIAFAQTTRRLVHCRGTVQKQRYPTPTIAHTGVERFENCLIGRKNGWWKKLLCAYTRRTTKPRRVSLYVVQPCESGAGSRVVYSCFAVCCNAYTEGWFWAAGLFLLRHHLNTTPCNGENRKASPKSMPNIVAMAPATEPLMAAAKP